MAERIPTARYPLPSRRHRKWHRKQTDDCASVVFTSQEICTALYHTYPERFTEIITGKYTVAMELQSDDALVVRYWPKVAT